MALKQAPPFPRKEDLVRILLMLWLCLWSSWTKAQERNRREKEDPSETLQLDSSQLEVAYRAGFADTLFADQANVAALRLENRTDQVLRGRIVILHVGGTQIYRHAVHASEPFELGQQARQTRLLSFHDLGERGFVLEIQDENGEPLWRRYHYCEGVNLVGGRRLREERIRLWTVTQEALLEAGPTQPTNLIDPTTKRRLNGTIGKGKRDIHQDRLPPWALPSESIPYRLVDGVLLGTEALDQLTRGQEQALAESLAFGGIVMVPAHARAFETRLASAIPYEIAERDARVVPVGLGKLVRYPPEALRHDAREANAWLYELLDDARPRISPIATPNDFGTSRYGRGRYLRAIGDRAAATKRWCLLFALGCAFFTGPFAWLFRKWPRRRFLWLLGSMVATFCILAILLGLSLNHVKGEVWMSTVTEVSAGGGVQTIMVDAESAGAREHRLALDDPMARFCMFPQQSLWHWQPHVKDLPLLPWTRESAIAMTLVPEIRPLSFRMRMTDATTVEIAWDNPNKSFELQALQVVIASNDGREVDAFSRGYVRAHSQTFTGSLTTLIILNRDGGKASKKLGRGSSLGIIAYDLRDEVRSGSFHDSTRRGVSADFNASLFTQLHRERYVGLLVAQISRSPKAGLSGSESDFISSGELHYLVQRLQPDALPPYEALFTKDPYPTQPASATGRRRVIIPR